MAGKTSTIVTDIKWTKSGEPKMGFYMDGYLRQNLDPIPKFLEKSYDCVGIISGHGKVRIGKSTMAMQVGYYIAWRMAGGEMGLDSHDHLVVTKSPDKIVQFDLNNVVFSPDELMEKAYKLPAHSVIVYDEGRAGLDSARAMENINKGMQDFFQECGVLGHIILIVLPNFFRLHEDYAVARSLFLIDVYNDENYERGYFNFYNERAKENLYFFGKKRIGITAKYAVTQPNFYGKFGGFMPFDKDAYDEAKKAATKKKRASRQDKRFRKERDAGIYLAKKYSDMTNEQLAIELSAYSNGKVSSVMIERAISRITHREEEDST